MIAAARTFFFAALSAAATLDCVGAETTTKTPRSAEQIEAEYTRAIEGRSSNILAVLELEDPARSRVNAVLLDQYRSLRAWHDTNDARLKTLRQAKPQTGETGSAAAREELARIDASLKALHQQFLAKLARDLSPPQIEQVKDEMTYRKVQVTYDAYVEIVPNLTHEERGKILEFLKAAREEAMDAGSAAEKSAVFKQYKGKINNYLTAQGHDVKQAYKDWGAKQKPGERVLD